MSTNFLIGVFDSGIGGLSVLKEIRKQLPDQDFIYIADSVFTPYGEKSEEEITQRCLQLVESLISRGAGIIVVACNTATAIAVNALRRKFSVPIVAMEPAVKPAVENSQKGKVGILATTMTLSSHRYAHLLERFASGTEVIEQACPGLVEQVENMQLDSEQTDSLLHRYLDPLVTQHVDAVVLGCTHYPFLRAQIENITGKDIVVIDTAIAVTRELQRKLEAVENTNKDAMLEHRFFTTGSVINFQQQLDFYWPEKVTAASINLDD